MIDATATLPSRREKRKQEIRSRIEDAAYTLFKRDGIQEVSIEQICDAADVARRTFYGHYPNKQALLQSLSQSRVWGTADEMIQHIRDTHDSTLARMSAMIDYMEENLGTYEAVDRALILIGPSSFEEKNHLREVSNSLRDHFIEFFRSGQHKGDTSADFSPELLAEMVMGTINALMANWAINPDYPIFDKLEEARTLFERVIGPTVQKEC
jgi:AcrR family transcriptional regulator